VAAGVLTLAVWLFLTAAELCTPLHAWLHGGNVPDKDDDCAIVAIAHGKVESAPVAVTTTSAVIWVETAPRLEFRNFYSSILILPDGRGPPALLLPS
jgi:hypothetical protein